MQQDDVPLNTKEKTALRQLFRQESSPSDVQLKLIEAMKSQGLLHLPKPLLSASVPGIFTALLLAAGLLATGFWAGKSQDAFVAQAAPATEKPQYVLLVRSDDVAPSDPSQQFREYSAWIDNLKKERSAGGEALHGNAWLLHKNADKVQVDAQELTGGKDEISGYFLFEANTAEEALKIAQTCPHLNYQGTLELREIYK